MPKLVNRAKMTTATTGTGTITLGSAVDGYQSFAAAGVVNGDVVRYVIEDGNNWEIGLGTYTASGTTLTRGSIESSNADNPINLSGNAVVYVSAAAADLQELVDFADNFVLPTADGSTGQVLTTNGAGTLSFITITGYTDADVDDHLNTGTAASGEVLSWNGSDYDWITGGGGLTLLSESTISSATYTVTVTFPSGYKVYQLVFKNVRQSINNESIRFQRLDSSGTAITGSTAYFYSSHDTSTTVTSSSGASFWQVNPSGIRPYTNSQAYAGLNFNFVFWGVRESTNYMAGIGEGTYLGAAAVANVKLRMSATTAEQNNGIRMQSENGSSFISGTILLYGVA